MTQQILRKKNSYNTDVSKRNLKTNQLTASEKVARVTDAENFSLNTYGADAALKEFFGPRSDDSQMKTEMIQDIMTQGYTQQKNYTDNIQNKHTLNTVDVYFTGAGIKTDLITTGLELPGTTERKAKRSRRGD